MKKIKEDSGTIWQKTPNYKEKLFDNESSDDAMYIYLTSLVGPSFNSNRAIMRTKKKY